MHQQKSKKIIIYIFLLILVGSTNNIKLNDLKIEKIKHINVSGLKDNENIILLNDINNLHLENILFLNGKEISNLINSNTLVKSFKIFKKYPSTIDIKILRTDFLAKINDNGKIFIVGSNGKLLEDKFSNESLPFIFGKAKVQEFLNFKKIIDQSKFSYDQIENLYFFPSKRWDLKLKNDIVLKLSKDKPKLSLDNAFEILNHKDFKSVKIVDARVNNQIILNE